MNNIAKRILSIVLSISIVIISSLSLSFNSYAIPKYDWVDGSWKKASWKEISDELYAAFMMAGSTMGAVVAGDFKQTMQNLYDWDDLWDESGWLKEHISYDVENDAITLDAELMALLKQALKEYIKKNNNYSLVWSTGFNELPYKEFDSKSNVYNTLKNVLDTVPGGTVKAGFQSGSNNGFAYTDIYISAFDNLRDVGFVRYGNLNEFGISYSMSTFEVLMPDFYTLRLYENDAAISSWEDFKANADVVNNLYDRSATDTWMNGTRSQNYFCDEYKRYRNLSNNFIVLLTRTRTTFRMFYTSADLFDYSLGKRGVYTTSDFWEKEPEDFTATFEELNDSIDRMDDILQRLLDKINDKTDESTIEDLLQQILDEMKNGGGSGGSGGTSGGSSGGTDLSGIYGFLQSILDYLDSILGMLAEGFSSMIDQLDMMILELGMIYESLDGLTEDNVSEKAGSMMSSLMDSFSEIGDMLKGKFPFSIPWDIYSFLKILSGEEVSVQSDTGAVVISSYKIDAVNAAVIPLAGDAAAVAASGSSAPVFELPFNIDSAGFNGTVTIDMEPFDYVSKLSRTLLTLFYCLCLMNLTLKIIPIGKELISSD